MSPDFPIRLYQIKKAHNMNTVYHDNKGSLVKSSEEDVRLEQSKRVDDINIKQSESKPEKYKNINVIMLVSLLLSMLITIPISIARAGSSL